MNCETMSDFEVNKKLAKLRGIGFCCKKARGSDTQVRLKLGIIVDYCNSWSDIGPLIEEYKITMESRESIPKLGWIAFKNNHDATGQNPKRAAAICIIKLLSK